jgi:cell division septation protein DedD
MRNAFFLLVLANLGYAAWHSWYSPSRVPHAADTDLPKLTLVREVPPEVADRREANATAPEVHLPTDDAALARAQQASGAGGQGAPQGTPAASARQSTPASPAKTAPAPASTPPSASAPARTSGSPPASTQTPASAASPARDASAATRCMSVGPFRDLAQAATAAATLRTSGYQPTQRVADGDIWIGYWIYIDAIPTEAEANAILAKVRGQGITESYVIPNSDSGNLVSLGVFGEISNVTRRREQVRALGYDPKVVDRTRRGTVYWVDVVLTADQTLDFDKLQTPGKIQRLEQRACEAPAH